jgi:hypothetical protein
MPTLTETAPETVPTEPTEPTEPGQEMAMTNGHELYIQAGAEGVTATTQRGQRSGRRYPATARESWSASAIAARQDVVVFS